MGMQQITIITTDLSEKDTIVRVLMQAEEDGPIDFPFHCHARAMTLEEEQAWKAGTWEGIKARERGEAVPSNDVRDQLASVGVAAGNRPEDGTLAKLPAVLVNTPTAMLDTEFECDRCPDKFPDCNLYYTDDGLRVCDGCVLPEDERFGIPILGGKS